MDISEEDYFPKDRKAGRAERKRLSAKDRSKYKKTDQKQRKRLAEEQYQELEGLERGRVLSIASEWIEVDTTEGMLFCTLRGLLKKERSHAKNLVTVGDFVLLERISPEEGVIAHIEPRKSVLSRADNLSRKKEQLIAANIDQVLITVSVVAPPLKPTLIDRYIIAARKGGMEPIIVVNKIDLLPDHPEEQKLYQTMLTAYQGLRVPIISVSAATGEGLDKLKAIMQDKASVFSGQSGVGKSSLINATTGLDLLVGDVVEKTRKGAHTTTQARLLRLSCGGWCIDTPGIKSFGLWDLHPGEVEQYYSEISSWGEGCKYPNCRHLNEPGCVVIQAVEDGEISPLRYASYQHLMGCIAQEHKKR